MESTKEELKPNIRIPRGYKLISVTLIETKGSGGAKNGYQTHHKLHRLQWVGTNKYKLIKGDKYARTKY